MPAISLRRGLRAIDSFTRRMNIMDSRERESSCDSRSGPGDCGQIYDDIRAVHAGGKAYGIAAARQSDLGYVNRRSAIAADERGALLPEAHVAADLASIERGGILAIWFANDHEANRRALQHDKIEAHACAVHRSNRHADDVAIRRELLSIRRGSGDARINKFGGKGKNHHEAQKCRGRGPNPLALMFMLAKAPLRRIFVGLHA